MAHHEAHDRVEAEILASEGSRKFGLAPKDIHVLICEDDMVTRKIVERLVQACDYQATTAENGQIALELLQQNPEKFSILLSDVVMPELTGLDLLRKIRMHEKLRDMPVVMMSAMDEAKLAYRCLHEGADDYILKPIRQELIQGLWRNLWRKRRESDKTRQLEEETRRRMEMESRISSLQSKVTEAISTPLSAIVKTVGDLITGSQVSDDVKNTLGIVLQSLQTSQLYQPALENFVNSQDMDEETKSWFMSQTNAAVKSKDHPTFAPSTSRADFRLDAAKNAAEEDIIGQLRSLDFDVWKIDEENMVALCIEMFVDLNLLDKFHIDPEVMRTWLNTLRATYKDNPYHNFRHAFDVTQMTYYMLTTGGGLDLLTPIDVLAVMIASICHDLDHPGCNNSYLMKTRAELAITYNDKNVLENHHSAVTFTILGKRECNILAGLTTSEWDDVRKLIIKIILATDLAVHVEVLTRWDAGVESFSKTSPEDRALLLQLIVKCSDISNPLRPWMLAKYWSDMIVEEGFRQGDKERERGLPVLPFMDRATCNQAKMSVGFIDIFVNPLFTSCAKVLPNLSATLQSLSTNRYRWESMLDTQMTDGGGGGATTTGSAPPSTSTPAAAGTGGAAAVPASSSTGSQPPSA